MPAPAPPDNEAFRRFLRRVWREDVAPLLRDQRAAQRKKTARVGGKLAAATGLFVDGLFGLKGKPFARFMTVMGSSLGAILPDIWDWEWFRESAQTEEREAVAEKVRQRAAKLAEAEALGLFELPPSASREQFKQAWRTVLHRWHPDKAKNEKQRAEFHVRFLAYQAAHERLEQAYEAGRLPMEKNC